MKIAVYTITKNEEQFMERWASSAQDADYLLIADTGSTDNTRKKALIAGVDKVVNVTVSPWRFDDARNASLAHIPADIDLCIALDADEVLVPGWREHLEALSPDVTRPRYKYVWSWNEDGSEGVVYGGDKIHARNGYRWKHPVHESITPSMGFLELQEWCGLEIHHFPDHTKSRGQYGPMLAIAAQESPQDDRIAYYNGRELTYTGDFEGAVTELKRFLSLPTAVWGPERSAACRLIANCSPGDEENWLVQATQEAPDRREPWVELSNLYYTQGKWHECLLAAKRAIAIKEKPLEYLCEADSWGSKPYDLAAIAAFRLGLPECEELGKIAVSMCPEDERLIENLGYYEGIAQDVALNE
jgi:tetratricopeptide (TPR) repeat protein